MMSDDLIAVPQVKVVRCGKKYGVKVKWPRNGPWTRTLLFPRFVWHGPFGNTSYRWDQSTGAISFANLCEQHFNEAALRARNAGGGL